jgi:ribosomal protein S18 acetylase RimI-like enzyme
VKRAIEFRPLSEDDLPALFGWLRATHVSKWYASAPSSFAEVAAKYGPRTQESNAVRAFVFSVDGKDAGYIQAYPIEAFPEYEALLQCGKATAGVDLFIGEESLVGWGLGPRVIRRFVDERVFGAGAASVCLAGPGEGNAAAIRAFEKAGFQRWKVVQPDGGESEQVMRREQGAVDCRIEPVNVARDGELCAAFRRSMYFASFGTNEGLEEEMGVHDALYLGQLREKIAEVPEGNVHLWRGERIVGQAEMRLVEGEPDVGYVSLFYVIPECRGQGLGRVLHAHALEVFRRRGMRVLRLSVSGTNAPALAFYRALGWNAVGTRPNQRPMTIMEYALA